MYKWQWITVLPWLWRKNHIQLRTQIIPFMSRLWFTKISELHEKELEIFEHGVKVLFDFNSESPSLVCFLANRTETSTEYSIPWTHHRDPPLPILQDPKNIWVLFHVLDQQLGYMTWCPQFQMHLPVDVFGLGSYNPCCIPVLEATQWNQSYIWLGLHRTFTVPVTKLPMHKYMRHTNTRLAFLYRGLSKQNNKQIHMQDLHLLVAVMLTTPPSATTGCCVLRPHGQWICTVTSLRICSECPTLLHSGSIGNSWSST